MSVYNQHLGLMQVPPNSRYLTNMSVVWGMDNGRFACFDRPTQTWHAERWNRGAFLDLLATRRDLAGCRFVVAPDVFMNAQATTHEFWVWRDFITDRGYPVAYALQDGATFDMVPWGACDALFIGGSNAAHFGETVRAIVHAAKRLEMWVHWGRGSTPTFLHYARAIGCDSCDSSAFARFTNDRLTPIIPELEVKQAVLFSEWDCI